MTRWIQQDFAVIKPHGRVHRVMRPSEHHYCTVDGISIRGEEEITGISIGVSSMIRWNWAKSAGGGARSINVTEICGGTNNSQKMESNQQFSQNMSSQLFRRNREFLRQCDRPEMRVVLK
jgi:hypothetical protein